MGVLGATVSPMPSYPHLSRADKDALAAWVVTLQAATARSLRASGGWVRAAPPSARVTAAYLTLENDGDRERVLVGAAAEGFEAAEIHESVERQGSASMRPVERLAIPAGEARVLAPGGVHVMLMGGRSPLAEGAELELALRFADGEELVVKLPVRAREPGS
jgi:copper(I)-binding protein